MTRRLEGRAALITGASSGIGRATALACSREGMKVALMARGPEAIEELAGRIRAGGGEALSVPGDVSREEDCVRAVSETERSFGTIDVLVNNAGYGLIAWFEETPPEEAARIVRVNLLGSFYTTRAALPGMKGRRSGHILFVSSGVGKKGIAGYALYAATKFGQVGLADALRAEVAPLGIAVSVVFPISTQTRFRSAMSRPGPAFPPPAGGPVQSAEHVARSIVKCLKRPRPEVYPFPPLRWLSAFNQLFPALGSRLVGSVRRPPPRA